MNKKEKTNLMKNIAVECILKYIGSTNSKKTRKDILDNATKIFNEKCKQSKIAIVKKAESRSYIGMALNDLLIDKTLFNKNGVISKIEEDKIIVDKAKCRTILLDLLKKKEYKKADLYKTIIKELGANKTTSKQDDNEIKEYIGNLLSSYVNDCTLEIYDNKYRIKNKINEKHPTKPISETEFKEKFLSRLHENGGSFFERFFANVLEKYFTLTGRTVWDCTVSGGSNDGGIDIKIKLSDDLGFVDEIMVQAKCRINSQVTENEIRNFYGAMNAIKASRGIYVTTSTFHPNANKLLHSLDNCVGIDGDGVFNLSKKVLYGMKITHNGYTFDEMVFDI